MVIISTYTMGRRPDYFSCPNEMKPDRWDRSKSSNFQPHISTAYMPWGKGIRSCVGRRLAETTMFLIVLRLLSNYRIKSENDVKPILKMVTTVDQEVKIRISSRKKS